MLGAGAPTSRAEGATMSETIELFEHSTNREQAAGWP